MEVVGCYFEYKNKILLLKRHPSQSQGNTWGLPAGKIEKGETPSKALVREIHEELGIRIKEEDLEEFNKMYVRRDTLDYIFYQFRTRFSTMPILKLDLEENIEARWVTISAALKLPLIGGGPEALLDYQKFKEMKKRKV